MTASVDGLTIQPFPASLCPHTPSNYVLARALGAGVAEAITVPAASATTSGRYVRLCGTVDFYYSTTTTATVPGDTTDGTACELVPAGKVEWLYISGVTTISVISAATCIVTASFFRD